MPNEIITEQMLTWMPPGSSTRVLLQWGLIKNEEKVTKGATMDREQRQLEIRRRRSRSDNMYR